MNEQLRKLEKLVERELTLLDELPPTEPEARVVARVKAAVRSEAARQRGPLPARWHVPQWIGIAAAVLLSIGLLDGLRLSPAPVSPGTTIDAAAQVDLLVGALDDAGDRFAYLLNDGWLVETVGEEYSAPVDGLLESFDEAYEQFGTL